MASYSMRQAFMAHLIWYSENMEGKTPQLYFAICLDDDISMDKK